MLKPNSLSVSALLIMSALCRGQGIISTVAGGGNNFPGDGGPATSASLLSSNGVSTDTAGNLYIVEAANYRVRKVNSAGVISTLAGNGMPGIGFVGSIGDGGPATSGEFFFGGLHEGVAVDRLGNVYITDSHNYRVRKVDTNGIITTFAGGNFPGSSGDGGPATKATFNSPASVAVDNAGNVYIGDLTGARVRKVDTNGVITTVAGNGSFGFSGDGGAATSATFNAPIAVAVDAAGNLYIADNTAQRVRKVDTHGIIRTVAGNGTAGFSGDGGPATSAAFFGIHGIAVDTAGNLYITDNGNKRIRKVDASGTITTVVGTGTFGNDGDGGSSTSATLSSPHDVFVDSSGNLYIGDSGRVRKVSSPGSAPLPVTNLINTVAGGGTGSDGSAATSASLAQPEGVAVDSAGNIYIADPLLARIRKVNAAGIISTVAGNGTYGFAGDGGPATSASLLSLNTTHQGLAADNAGNLYIADINNQRIRKVNSAGIISTVAGNGDASADYPGDGGQATAAAISYARGVAVDNSGNLYIATGNNRVVKVNSAGIISTVAGTGAEGSEGDGGPATKATLNSPTGIAFDGAANLYIAESNNSLRVRKVNPAGIISTVAGSGKTGFSGDGGPAVNATFSAIDGIAADSSGNLYITDRNNNRVRKVDTSGTISTFAGTGTFGFTGDGGTAASATVSAPGDVAVDSSGNVYIADSQNVRIRKVAVPPGPPAITLVANAFGNTPLLAPNMWVEIIGSNLGPSGDTRIWQGSDFANNLMPTQLDGVSVTVNGQSVYIYYISPTQIDILTPPDTLPVSVSVQVTNGGTKSNLMNVQAQPIAPSFFVFDTQHVTATHLNGNLLGPSSLYPGYSTPAKPTETVVLYANGFGPTTLPVVSGSSSQGGTLAVLPEVKIGGIPATVSYAGLVSPGTFQFNVEVPASAPDGDNSLTATYNGSTTQAGVTIAVQH